jgi:hypothetical protein
MKCLRFVRFEYEISLLTSKPHNVKEGMSRTLHGTHMTDY